MRLLINNKLVNCCLTYLMLFLENVCVLGRYFVALLNVWMEATNVFIDTVS